MLNLLTTSLVIAWAAVFSLFWAGVVYVYFRKSRLIKSGTHLLLLPALVVSPLFIISGFGMFGLNLIFPAHTSMSAVALILYCALPALVLFIASGLGFELFAQVRLEHEQLSAQQFYLFARALGQPIDRITARMVITKGITEAWVKCIPWFFGELIVVEAMFNAPGLGFHSWMYARVQNFEGLAASIMWLVGLYSAIALLAGAYNRWMGSKLEGYH